MADIVASVLQSAAEKEAQFKTTEVIKDIDVYIDEGNLLAADINQLDMKLLRSHQETYLQSATRDNVQLLFNKIWDLPTERVEEAVVAQLPDPNTRLPREKPIPAKEKLTKWQEYAKLKGINNKKKSRKVWDDNKQEWLPAWGYKSAKNERDWLLEVPQNADIYEDQFAKKSKAKKERVAKNELQRLRNISRRMKGKVPGVGLTPVDKPEKDHLQHAMLAARKSDASLGRFSDKVKKEEKYSAKSGKKRKFEPTVGDSTNEKSKSLKILDRVTNKNPILNIQKAVGKHLASEQQQRSASIQNSSSKGGKKGKKGGGGGKAGAKGGANKSRKSPYAKKSAQFKKGAGGGKPGGKPGGGKKGKK